MEVYLAEAQRTQRVISQGNMLREQDDGLNCFSFASIRVHSRLKMILSFMILSYFPSMNIHLRTFPNSEELIFQTLELFRSIFATPSKDAANGDGIMLAGGRTPLEIYRRAAADLSRRSSAKAEGLSTEATLFLSDERYVPTCDPQSNYGGIAPFFKVGQASCLSAHALRQPLSHFIRVKTELPIEEAAQAFHNDLSQIGHIPLGLLGLGADGHTASLFNLEDAALRDERLAIPVQQCRACVPLAQNERDARSTFTNQRISVTPTLLNRIERIIILATGAEKKEMIQTLLNKPETIPAGVALADHPNVEIWTDQNI